MRGHRCATCDSPEPGLHPAMQFEGEVQICLDDFHLTPTWRNTPRRIQTAKHHRFTKAADTLAHAVAIVRHQWHNGLPRAEAQANLDARAILLKAENAVVTEGEQNAKQEFPA